MNFFTTKPRRARFIACVGLFCCNIFCLLQLISFPFKCISLKGHRPIKHVNKVHFRSIWKKTIRMVYDRCSSVGNWANHMLIQCNRRLRLNSCNHHRCCNSVSVSVSVVLGRIFYVLYMYVVVLMLKLGLRIRVVWAVGSNMHTNLEKEI